MADGNLITYSKHPDYVDEGSCDALKSYKVFQQTHAGYIMQEMHAQASNSTIISIEAVSGCSSPFLVPNRDVVF